MDAPVSPRKYSFIVGLNNQNYPGFKAMNGLFDETFIRNSNYPSATYRQELTTTNLKWIFNSGQHITIALSQNNFDGKANEYPLFINKKEIIKVPALSSSGLSNHRYTLNQSKMYRRPKWHH